MRWQVEESMSLFHATILWLPRRPNLVEVVQKVEAEVDRTSGQTFDTVDASYGHLTCYGTIVCML